jgi:hypothetical protein
MSGGIRGRVDSALARVAAVPPELENEIAQLRIAIGRHESRVVRALPPGSIRESEFKVFSQFGEDGIIQHLLAYVDIPNEVFVEFGTGDYSESNTRFLLWKDNWRGVIIDGSPAHVQHLDRTEARWRHDIEPITAFIDRDNIDDLIRSAGVDGDIGLLSIDVDGNDWWILERIGVVSPRILVLEYNSTFGPEASITVPYDPSFVRSSAHWSNLYWGASLAALTHLANKKGFALVGGNQAGNNAFFVRRDVLGQLPEVTVADAYRPSRFRESRDQSGQLTYLGPHSERLLVIADLPVRDVVNQRDTTVGAATS